VRIALVGEAWGKDEEAEGHAFVGQSGLELARMLYESGLNKLPPPDCFVSPTKMKHWWAMNRQFILLNVLNFRPRDNNFDALLVKKIDAAEGLPPLSQGKYFPKDLVPHLERLHSDLAAAQPDLILALGAKPAWALLGTSRISSIRGTPSMSRWGKVLPTYHPAAILRQWNLRPIVLKDFEKASREATFRELRRPEREIIVNPTLEEMNAWADEELVNASTLIACDIETAFGQITCIGFAARPERALVVPFVDYSRPDWSYWDESSERAAWEFVQQIVGGPWPKVGQNFLYDLQYLMRAGIRPRNCREDTMLLHHALYPELQKGLGFLGSIYSNEPAWKLMREKIGDTLKRDE